MGRKRKDSDLPPLTCAGCVWCEWGPSRRDFGGEIGEMAIHLHPEDWYFGECRNDLAPRAGLTNGEICRNYVYRWTYEDADPGDRDFAEVVEEVMQEIKRERGKCLQDKNF